MVLGDALDKVLGEPLDLLVGGLLSGPVAKGRVSVFRVALELEENLERQLARLVAASQSLRRR